MQILTMYAQPVLQIVVTVIFGVLGVVIRRLMERYIDTDTKRTIAHDVVMAVEQICKDLHGEDKYNRALLFLSEQLANYNIRITEQEMRLLIEAAVSEFNAQKG